MREDELHGSDGAGLHVRSWVTGREAPILVWRIVASMSDGKDQIVE